MFHLRRCSCHIVIISHLEDCMLASLRKLFEGKRCSYTIRSIIFDAYLRTFGIILAWKTCLGDHESVEQIA